MKTLIEENKPVVRQKNEVEKQQQPKLKTFRGIFALPRFGCKKLNQSFLKWILCCKFEIPWLITS